MKATKKTLGSLVMTAASTLTLAAFADRTYTPAEGTVLTWQAPYDTEKGAYLLPDATWSQPLRKTVVAPNTQLSDLRVISSKCNSYGLPTGAGKCYNGTSWVGTARFVEGTRSATEVIGSMQAQKTSSYSPGTTAAVKIKLVQDGDDVVAYSMGAGYEDDSNLLDRNLFVEPLPAGHKRSPMDLTTTSATKIPGYGIDQLTMAVGEPTKYTVTEDLTSAGTLYVGTNVTVEIDVATAFPGNVAANPVVLAPGGTLVFKNPPTDFQFTGAVSGVAGAIKFEGAKDQPRDHYYDGCISDPKPFGLKSPYAVMPAYTNVLLQSITNVTGFLSGHGFNKPMQCATNVPAAIVFENNGKTARAQFQLKNDDARMYVVVIDLAQDGDIVTVKSSAKSVAYAETGYGYDIIKNPKGIKVTPLDLAAGVTNSGICAVNVSLHCAYPKLTHNIQLTGTNTSDASDVLVDGPVEVKFGSDVVPVMPNNGLVRTRDGGTVGLYRKAGGSASGQFANHVAGLVAEAGGRFVLSGQYPLDVAFSFTAIGKCSEINVAVNSGYILFNNLLLMDGALLTGDAARVGYTALTPRLCVDGTMPIGQINNPIKLPSQARHGVNGTWRLCVNDVTGDATPDLYLNGSLTHPDNTIRSIVKECPGTVRLGAANDINGNATIKDGVLELAANDALKTTNSVTIAGGALGVTAATTNAVGALTVTAAVLDLRIAENALLTFASASIPDTTQVAITGSIGPESLRIGTTKCLSDTLIKNMRYVPAGGRRYRVTQDENGYLVPYTSGLIMMVR